MLGPPAPWATVSRSSAPPTVAEVQAALDSAGPAHPSPVEAGGFDTSFLPEPMRQEIDARPPRPSAVLAPLYDHDGQAWVVLTRRSADLRSHSGEISFPGGGFDEADLDLRTTALREAHEETGMAPGSVEIIGELDHLSTITSRSFIVPFVGVLPGRPDLTPNQAEVDAILHVPLAELLLPEIYHEEIWMLGNTPRTLVFFELVGDTLWGATAAMLRQLLGLLTGTVARGELGHD